MEKTAASSPGVRGRSSSAWAGSPLMVGASPSWGGKQAFGSLADGTLPGLRQAGKGCLLLGLVKDVAAHRTYKFHRTAPLSDSVDIRFHEAGRTRGCVSPAGGHSPRKSASLSWVRVRGFPAYSVDSGKRQEYSLQGFAWEERLAVFWPEKPKSLTQCNQVHRLMRSLL